MNTRIQIKILKIYESTCSVQQITLAKRKEISRHGAMHKRIQIKIPKNIFTRIHGIFQFH